MNESRNPEPISGQFAPPAGGANWSQPDGSPLRAWQGKGGTGRLHPARALPSLLTVQFPNRVRVGKIVLQGCLALYASARHEPFGTIGAEIHAGGFSFKLANGRHYRDAAEPATLDRVNGDGSRLVTVGEALGPEGRFMVDELTVELATPQMLDSFEIRFFDTSSSFVLFEAWVVPVAAECPFRGHGGRISLAEVGSIVRLRDWERFEQAVGQLHRALVAENDLDDAKGSVLTFLAVVSSAILDFGGNRKLHRFQLDSARRLDRLATVEEVAKEACLLCQNLVGEYLPVQRNHTTAAIDRALRYVESRFAMEITDDEVAEEVGLSTSHFRHLFRERTGVPFHKYLLNLRLERARQEILAGTAPIREVAEQCGFVSSAHFSRAFSHRFGMPPKQLRESV